MMIASADGCKAGWLVALSDSWPCKSVPRLIICKEFRCMLSLLPVCETVVLDIPIGLPEAGAKRTCDLDAREALGEAGRSRVFFAPPRVALQASTPHEFQANLRRLTGAGAGLPVWGIVPKLHEVDAAMKPELQQQIFEFHPELVWRRLAGKTLTSKHTPEGIQERLDVLRPLIPELDALLRWTGRTGRAVSADDILDALVGLSAADAIGTDTSTPRRLPAGEVPTDSRGLRMEMWF